MSTDRNPLIVNDGQCGWCAVHTKQVHHRDMPELWAEAGTVSEAVEHLVHQLSRARDGAACPLHRETIDRAMSEIMKGLELFRHTENPTESACHCGPRGANTPADRVLELTLAP
jgi:hypothetical protein